MFFNNFPPARRAILVVMAFLAMLPPAAAFAKTSGGDGNLQPSQIVDTRLPFLRDASSGSSVTSTGGPTKDPVAVSGGLSSQAHGCRFNDINGDGAEHAINYLYDKKVAGGRQPCKFEPKAAATRAEATTMAVRAIQATVPSEVGKKPFPDVKTTAWNARYISAAKSENIVHGYPDEQFRPDQAINRVEALKIVTRAFDTDFTKVNFENLKKYSDIELNQWYVQYVDAGLDQGLLGGNNAPLTVTQTGIYPASYITRSELADMIYVMMIKREEINSSG